MPKTSSAAMDCYMGSLFSSVPTIKIHSLAGSRRTWMDVGSKTACDTDAGEVFMPSSREVASLEECKKSCEGVAGCQSITYFKSRWCSHFSTPCSNTKRHNKAASHRLSTGSRNNTGSISIASRYVPEHGIRMYKATM